MNINGLAVGDHQAVISVTDFKATNMQQMLRLNLHIDPAVQPEPKILVEPSVVGFTTKEGSNPLPRELSLTNDGDPGTELNWSIEESCSWLEVSPMNGQTMQGGQPSILTFEVISSNLSQGSYNTTVNVVDPNASNNPFTIDVTLNVEPNSGNDPSGSENVDLIGKNAEGLPRKIVVDNVSINDFAFIAAESMVTMVDVADPLNTKPRQVDYFDAAQARDIVIKVSMMLYPYAYIATGNGVQVIEISDPGVHHNRLGFRETPGEAQGLVLGNQLFVADGAAGIQVIDTGDKEKLEILNHFDTRGPATSVDIDTYKNTLYVGEGTHGIEILDVGNINQITKHSDFTSQCDVQDIQMFRSGYDDYITVANGEYGVLILDVDDPEHPKDIGRLSIPDGYVYDAYMISYDDDTAYIAAGEAGFYSIKTNFNNANPPEIIGHADTTGIATGVCAYKDSYDRLYAYVTDDKNSLEIFDLQNPAQPVKVNQLDSPGYAKDVTVSNGYAYVADKNRLTLVDVNNPTDPHQKSFIDTAGDFVGVDVEGSYAYGLDRNAGLRIVDVSDPEDLQEQGISTTIQDPKAVDVSGNYAYIADGGYGLKIVDVSNPSNPIQTAVTTEAEDANGITVIGDTAYVADGAAGLKIFDVSNPNATPVIKGVFNTPGYAYNVHIDGHMAYVADGLQGMVILDVQNPSNIQYINSFDTEGSAVDVAVYASRAYITDTTEGLRVIDVANPNSLEEIGYFDTPGEARAISMVGEAAYIADYTSGLWILRYSGGSDLDDLTTTDTVIEDQSGESQTTEVTAVVVGGDSVVSGNDLTLNVSNLNGGTVKSVVIAGIELPAVTTVNEDGSATVTVKIDSSIMPGSQSLELVVLDASGNESRIAVNGAVEIKPSSLANTPGQVKIQGGEKGFANPAKGETITFHYLSLAEGSLDIYIYTLQGNLVKKITASASAVPESIAWDCRNDDGSCVASGVYIAYIKGPGIDTKLKLAIVK
ncbi:MAG: hypothetical protein GF384_02035, partial [Elusimicrobia bacterium]|nr:hypothetical protein [Elusimicrobiota bacterium]